MGRAVQGRTPGGGRSAASSGARRRLCNAGAAAGRRPCPALTQTRSTAHGGAGDHCRSRTSGGGVQQPALGRWLCHAGAAAGRCPCPALTQTRPTAHGGAGPRCRGVLLARGVQEPALGCQPRLRVQRLLPLADEEVGHQAQRLHAVQGARAPPHALILGAQRAAQGSAIQARNPHQHRRGADRLAASPICVPGNSPVRSRSGAEAARKPPASWLRSCP